MTDELPPRTPDEQASAIPTAVPDPSTAETAAAPLAQGQQRVRSVSKLPVTCEQADEVGRRAVQAGASTVTFIAGVARYGARMVGQLARAVEAIPPTLRLLVLAGILTLLGIVGSIALHNLVGLACIVVVVPVCSMTLGAVGHRWYSNIAGQQAHRAVDPAADIPEWDLRRSVEYVDKKLTFALNSFSAERPQHAMIALFQAKTAVELTLGTEHDASPDDALFAADEYNMRPRIRPGSASKSSLRESNSLAAS